MPNQKQQAEYQPLNGKEIRTIVKKKLEKRIDEIPRMKEGHAYHQAVIAFSFTMTAVPADCPVPTAEFEEIIKSPGFNLQDHFINVSDKINSLENKKSQLLAQVEKIDELLAGIRVSEEVEEIIQAGTIPDEVRIDNDLPLPRIVTETTPAGGVKMTDKMINYDNL